VKPVSWRRLALIALVNAVVVLTGCGTVPIPPTYTQAELQAICERQGGWWHEDRLMGGYCEYQAPGQQF
jgi:hypothetical protein